jgi:hypothetical protein
VVDSYFRTVLSEFTRDALKMLTAFRIVLPAFTWGALKVLRIFRTALPVYTWGALKGLTFILEPNYRSPRRAH